jgi:hypothetical protein
MLSLYALTERVEVGGTLAWVGERAYEDVAEVHPRIVKSVERDGNGIRVDAEGPGDGHYYTVDRAECSGAFFVNDGTPKSMGDVAFAQLTASDDPVTVRRGYFDER